MNLTRWDNADIINYLCTTYEGNQLTKVTDNGCSPIDYLEKRYQDGADAQKEMFYDKNGNLIADFDRKICTIRYNVLSLPDTIQFTNGNQIVHIYDAMGNRLRTTYFLINQVITVTIMPPPETTAFPARNTIGAFIAR